MTLAQELGKVLELADKATPGEWQQDTIRCEGDYGDGGPDSKTGYNAYAIYNDKGRAIFDTINAEEGCVEEYADEDTFTAWDEVARCNAEAIVAIMNLLRSPHGPALLALAESAERPVAWRLKVGNRVCGDFHDLQGSPPHPDLDEANIEYACALPPAYRGKT